MKKSNKFLPLLLTLTLLTACSSTAANTSIEDASEENSTTTTTSATEPKTSVQPKDEEQVIETPEGHAYAEFTNGMPANWECANGWTNGSMFNVTWRKDNVTFNDGNMQLIIDNDKTPTGGIPYSGGEFRSKDFYGYGRYEVCMKPIKNDGVVSSFFTYTGPTDNNPWDEIDIEFLGKDTTIVQFNYFTNSQGNHEYIHDLGFDASENFHTYAFEWHEDKIIWFVDNVEVYTASENIPVTKSKIMMNAWCGTGVDGWLNAFNDTTVPLVAEYQWVKFTPFE